MPVAAIGAAVIGGAASISAANKAAKATKNASNQAAQTAQDQIALQREAYANAKATLTPYAQEGAAARRLYNGAMGIAPAAGTSTSAGVAGADTLDAARAAYNSGFETSPYWQDAQYATGQAMNALRSTNAAMGRGSSINSGKALRAASDIQQGYRGAATQNYLASLNNIGQTGLTADTGIASGGQNFANNASNALGQATALQGQYGMANAAAYGNAMSDIAGIAGYTAGNYLNGGQSYFQPMQSVTPINVPTPNVGLSPNALNVPSLYPGG